MNTWTNECNVLLNNSLSVAIAQFPCSLNAKVALIVSLPNFEYKVGYVLSIQKINGYCYFCHWYFIITFSLLRIFLSIYWNQPHFTELLKFCKADLLHSASVLWKHCGHTFNVVFNTLCFMSTFIGFQLHCAMTVPRTRALCYSPFSQHKATFVTYKKRSILVEYKNTVVTG